MCLAEQADKLLRALGMWSRLWRRELERTSDENLKWLGVAKNLHAIELLSRRIIQVAVSPEAGTCRYLQRVPSHGARADLNEFIRKFISQG